MPSKGSSSSAVPCFCAMEERSTVPFLRYAKMPLCALDMPKLKLPDLLDFGPF